MKHRVDVAYYLRRRLAIAGILSLGVTQVCVCPAEPRLHAALVSAAKVMRCIQCCLAITVIVVVIVIIVIVK